MQKGLFKSLSKNKNVPFRSPFKYLLMFLQKYKCVLNKISYLVKTLNK